MMDMCPTKILKIWGNSSKDVLRKKPPTLVIHFLGSASSCVGASCGVSMRIVRNFKIVNVFLCIPMRFCLKKAEPLLSQRIAIIKINIGNAKITMAIKERMMSITLFKKCLYISFAPNVFACVMRVRTYVHGILYHFKLYMSMGI